MGYLEGFRRKLESRWKGSLVSVHEAKAIDPNAKKYLGQLAKEGEIEKVTWGWYWIPSEYSDFFDFLTRDRHFKVLQKQTAAAFWSSDFVHRDHFCVAVKEPSYGRALEKFAASRGWKVSVEARDFKEAAYRRVGKLYVENLEETIVDCVKEWAFSDAFAAFYENYDRIDQARISRRHWERIPRTNIRVGQLLQYGASIISRGTHMNYSAARSRISDDFVRRQVEEATEKVVELG